VEQLEATAIEAHRADHGRAGEPRDFGPTRLGRVSGRPVDQIPWDKAHVQCLRSDVACGDRESGDIRFLRILVPHRDPAAGVEERIDGCSRGRRGLLLGHGRLERRAANRQEQENEQPANARHVGFLLESEWYIVSWPHPQG